MTALCLFTLLALQPPPGMQERTIRIHGTARWYSVYAPSNLPASGAPLVLLFHGGTQSMRKILGPRAGGTREWLDIARQERILLIAPNGTNAKTGDARGDNQSWFNPEDITFIGELIQWAARTHRIDRRRVYATGASNGGYMSYRLLLDKPDWIAAAAIFISNLPEAKRNATTRPAPVFIMNGTRDPLMKWEGGQASSRPEILLGSLQTEDFWIRANRAQRTPTATPLPDLDPADGCQISGRLHPAAAPNGAPVHFYTMEGGGHAMPSRAHPIPDTAITRRLIGPVCRDAEGARLAWDFLRQYSR